MRKFTAGDAIRFLVTFKNNSGVAFDPTSTWGRVYDSASTVVQSIAALTLVTTGNYYHDWQSDAASHGAFGVGAFEAFGRSGALVYRRREKLFKLV